MAKRQEDWGITKLQRRIEGMFGRLFHLTDVVHAQSIRQHGLLSAREADARGVYPALPGGNGLTRALDVERGLDDYVFLSFSRYVLMPKNEEVDHLRRPLMLHIHPTIIHERGVMVSLGRKTRSERFHAARAFYEMDWDVLDYPELRTQLGRWNRFLDYEILVPKCVPFEFVFKWDTCDE